MLGWSAAVHSCRFLVLSRRFSVLSFLGAILSLQPFGLVDKLNVVRSIGRLSDHGALSKPLPLVKDGDLIAIVRHMTRVWGLVTKVEGHATEADVDQGRVRVEDRLGSDEADTAAGVSSLRRLWMRDGRCSMLGSSGIPLCFNCIGLWFSSVSVNHDGRCGSAPAPLSGIKGVGKSNARLMLGLMLILPHFQARLAFSTAPGCRFGWVYDRC